MNFTLECEKLQTEINQMLNVEHAAARMAECVVTNILSFTRQTFGLETAVLLIVMRILQRPE